MKVLPKILLCSLVLMVVFTSFAEAIGQILNPAYAPAQRKRLIKLFYEKKDAECRAQCHETMVEMNDCLGRCISPACYDQFYLRYELEEGEVDLRYNHFRDCATTEAQKAWKDEDKQKSA